MSENLQALEAELARVAAEAEDLASREQEASVALDRVAGEDRIEAMADVKVRMEGLRRDLTLKQGEVREAHAKVKAEIERQFDEKRKALDVMARKANAALAPLEKMVKTLKEGIWTLGLYAGVNEHIEVIYDGAPAGELTPITIRQMVLAMDEESMLYADRDGVTGVTAEDVGAFDEWLREDWARVVSIVPEEKGIVAVVPRWTKRREEDWGRDEDDAKTHFIIRNGRRVFRVTCEFDAGDVLVPRADEFVEFFKAEEGFGKDRKSVALKPGTREYERAMENADSHGRHYLRIGLIFQGLVDRTEVFHPLHPAGIDMLTDPSARSEKVRIIEDAEGGLESGAVPFVDWHREAMAGLRVGMRVVGVFRGDLYRSDAGEYQYDFSGRRGNWMDKRIFPTGYYSECPQDGVPYTIESRDPDGAFRIRYERTKEIYAKRDPWSRYEERRLPKMRASMKLYKTDGFVIPYDEVTADMIDAWLASRRNRRSYKSLWPLLSSIRVAKRAEEKAEAPFIEMMVGVCARDNGEVPSVAEVRELAQWFKSKNKFYRPLVTGKDAGAGDALAVREIVREHARRLRDARRPLPAKAVEGIRARFPQAVLVARDRYGKWVVFDAARPTEDVFVHQHVANATAWDKPDGWETTEWVLPVRDRVSRYQIAYAHPRWSEWTLTASVHDHLTGPEVDAIIAAARKNRDCGTCFAVSYDAKARRFHEWVQTKDLVIPESRIITSDATEPKYAAFKRSWRRQAGVPTLAPRSQCKPSAWSEGALDAALWDGHYAKQETGLIIWKDDAHVERFRAERAAWVTFDAEVRMLTARARGLTNRLDDQVAYAARKVAFDKAVADGEDPVAWVKVNSLGRFQKTEYVSFGESRFYVWAVRRLVEDGVDLEGMTVAEAIALVDRDHDGKGLRAAWVKKNRWLAREDCADFPTGYGDLKLGAFTPPALVVEDPPEDDVDDEDLEEDVGGLVLMTSTSLGEAEVLGREEDEVVKDQFDELRDVFKGALGG